MTVFSPPSYALKLLQSEGQRTMASTEKDPVGGCMVTQEYRFEGPVMIVLTTNCSARRE
jgi:DNA primase